MNLSRPFEALTTAIDGDVLAALALAEDSFTGRELHRVMGRHSQTGVNKALQRLAQQGIVDCARVGSANVYRLNRDHLLAVHVIAIANAPQELIQRLAVLLAGWAAPPVYAALFGSAATNDGDHVSDIDLLFVHDDDVDPLEGPWALQLDDLVQMVGRWTGNDVRPVTLGRREVADRLRGGDPFIKAIRRSSVSLVGDASVLAATPG